MCLLNGLIQNFNPQYEEIDQLFYLIFLGKVMDNGHYLVGNTVQYSCHEGYVLIGEPIIRCTESGLWSHAPPFCKFIYATDI